MLSLTIKKEAAKWQLSCSGNGLMLSKWTPRQQDPQREIIDPSMTQLTSGCLTKDGSLYLCGTAQGQNILVLHQKNQWHRYLLSGPAPGYFPLLRSPLLCRVTQEGQLMLQDASQPKDDGVMLSPKKVTEFHCCAVGNTLYVCHKDATGLLSYTSCPLSHPKEQETIPLYTGQQISQLQCAAQGDQLALLFQQQGSFFLILLRLSQKGSARMFDMGRLISPLLLKQNGRLSLCYIHQEEAYQRELTQGIHVARRLSEQHCHALHPCLYFDGQEEGCYPMGLRQGYQVPLGPPYFWA